MIVYKIVQKLDTNKYKYLFHERKKVFKCGDILIASKRMGYEAYKNGEKNLYLTGIHVVETLEFCEKYLQRFKKKADKAILKVEIIGEHRVKPNARPGVLLADSIKILEEVKIS